MFCDSIKRGKKLFNTVKSFCNESKACVRVGSELSEWFPLRVDLRQVCLCVLLL